MSGLLRDLFWLDTGFNPAIALSPKFTQNSGSASAWAFDITIGTLIGTSSASSSIITLVPFTYGFFYFDINVVSDQYVTSPNIAGLYSADRSSATILEAWQNGILITSVSATSAAPYSTDLLIGNRKEGDVAYTGTISAAHIGASLGAAGQLALYNRLRTYLTAVGVP